MHETDALGRIAGCEAKMPGIMSGMGWKLMFIIWVHSVIVRLPCDRLAAPLGA